MYKRFAAPLRVLSLLDATARAEHGITTELELDCAAVQDCLQGCRALSPEQNREGKKMLLRIVSMLTKLARRDHELREEPAGYGYQDYDNGAANPNQRLHKDALPHDGEP